MRRTLRSVLGTLVVGALVACGRGDDRRPLVVYSAHAGDILTEFERSFEAAHPQVDVVWSYLSPQLALDRMRAERAAPQCDVWWGADAATLTTAARESLLAPYRPTYGEESPPHDAEWRWSGCFWLPMVLGFHPDRISREELPTTLVELGDPRFKDRIVLREPSASGGLRTVFAAVVAAAPSEDEGFNRLAALDRNVRAYEGSPELLFEALEKGPAALTVWNLTDLIFQRKGKGQEKGYRFLPAPFAEPTPTVVDGIAVTPRGAANADARAFYEHVNTLEALAALAERHQRIPVRPSFDRAKLDPDVRDFPWTPLAVDATVLAEKTPGWMRRFEEEILSRRTGRR
ncbi:MAG TPA: substrate-binding domain-containing protein [Planctomycetota bacterium]|nr:substrate-binding domain-containing protein [Planctomycetota bacterium]